MSAKNTIGIEYRNMIELLSLITGYSFSTNTPHKDTPQTQLRVLHTPQYKIPLQGTFYTAMQKNVPMVELHLQIEFAYHVTDYTQKLIRTENILSVDYGYNTDYYTGYYTNNNTAKQ